VVVGQPESPVVFERFTEEARQTIVLAHAQARELNHGHIGSEHILLGLLAAESTPAGRVLASFGVNAADARASVVAMVPASDLPGTQLPFTPAAKALLERGLGAWVVIGSGSG